MSLAAILLGIGIGLLRPDIQRLRFANLLPTLPVVVRLAIGRRAPGW